MSKAEQNYSTIEHEALAIMIAVNEFYPYLYGHEFVLQTNHQPLVHLNNLRNVGGRITCWSMFLQQFGFTVKHKAGRLNGNADGLSRTPSSTTVASRLAAAITEAMIESSDNFVIIREAQAKRCLHGICSGGSEDREATTRTHSSAWEDIYSQRSTL